MKILRRNVSKDEFTKFLENIDLNDEKLYEELSDNQNFIFQFSGSTGSRMTKELRPTNFDDVINLNAMSRPGSSYNFGNYTLIKNEGQKSPYPEQIQQFLKKSRGLINFQEEIMQIIEYLSPKKDKVPIWSGNFARGLLKRLGKAKKKKEDLDAWNEMVQSIKGNAGNLGIAERDIDMLCNDLLTLSAYTFNLSHAAAYSYLAMETVYLAKYFKPYFYSTNLANEAGKTDTIKDAIESCKNSGFEIEPPNINNSRTNFFPIGKKLYFGFNDIKGVGEEPAKIIVENQPYTSIIDFICKNVGTKINKRITSALIGGGAFDELIEGNRKYYQQVAEKFYDKKKSTKTIPLLMEKWEEAEKEIEKCETSPEDYIKYEETYLGGQFFHNKFSAIADKIQGLYKKGYCLRDFEEIRKKNLPKQYCFVYLSGWRVIKDKKGRDMSFATLEDRNGEKQSVPFFFNIYPYVAKKYFGDGFYLIDLYPTEEGKIMVGSRNWIRDERTLNNLMAKVPNV